MGLGYLRRLVHDSWYRSRTHSRKEPYILRNTRVRAASRSMKTCFDFQQGSTPTVGACPFQSSTGNMDAKIQVSEQQVACLHCKASRP